MIAITGEAIQFARDSGQVGGLGESLPALHDEHQQQLHQSHHVQCCPLVSSQSTLQGRWEVRVQQRLGKEKRDILDMQDKQMQAVHGSTFM